jgi:Bacterial regulatory protein, Fis family
MQSQGRPCKVIDPSWLKEATKPHRLVSMKFIAAYLGIHRNTLRRKLKEAGMYQRFTVISDQELDTLLRIFKRRRPESGLSYIVAFLCRYGVRVPGTRVRDAYKRINILGQVLRLNEKILRHEYNSPRPNFCWHCDGHHKLIRWGFVIHGFIDGYCRTVSAKA